MNLLRKLQEKIKQIVLYSTYEYEQYHVDSMVLLAGI